MLSYTRAMVLFALCGAGRPMTRYEIGSTIGRAASSLPPQIKMLEREGHLAWVGDQMADDGTPHRPKKVFTITDPGKDALMEWAEKSHAVTGRILALRENDKAP
jgi:DNA-binding PadR family transcriptional regulator